MVKNKYLDRITSEHRVRPRFMEWLAAGIEPVQDTIELYRSFDGEYDLEKAQGVQLDQIGEAVGVGRLLDFEPIYAAPLLSDAYYRMIIKAKIGLNHWDGSTRGIRELWQGIYKDYTMEILDWQDMSITLRIINEDSQFECEFISRGYLAPKPESVRVNYEFVFTRNVKSELYVGGKITGKVRRFELDSPHAAFNMRDGIICVGGKLSIYKRFSLQSAVERM